MKKSGKIPQIRIFKYNDAKGIVIASLVLISSLLSISLFSGSNLKGALEGTTKTIALILVSSILLRSFRIRFRNLVTDITMSAIFAICLVFLIELFMGLNLAHWALLVLVLIFCLVGLMSRSGTEENNKEEFKLNGGRVKSLQLIIFIVLGFELWNWYSYNLGFVNHLFGAQQIDVSLHETLANRIAKSSNLVTSLSSEGEFSYHFLVHFVIGKLNELFIDDPFLSQIVFIPTLSSMMVLVFIYAFTARITPVKDLRYVPSLLFLVFPGFTIGNFWFIQSPSMSFGIAFLLATLLVQLHILDNLEEGNANFFGILILGVLSWLSVYAKTTNILFILIFFSYFTFCSYKMLRGRDQFNKAKILHMLGYTVLCLFIFLSLRSALTAWSWARLARDAEIYEEWSFIGLNLGFLPEIFICMSILVLPMYLKRHKEIDTESFYLLMPVSLVGSASLFLKLDDGNEVYFLITACVLILPLVPRLLIHIGDHAREGKLMIFTIILSFFGAFTFEQFESLNSRQGQLFRGLLPVFSYSIVLLVYLLIKFRIFGKKVFLKMSFGFMIFIHIFVFSSSGLFSVVLSGSYGPLYSGAAAPIGFGAGKSIPYNEISQDFLNAGKWVRENTKVDDLFATNHLCLNRQTSLPQCDSRWYGAEAVTRRQFLIEGISWRPTRKSDERLWILSQSLNSNFSTELTSDLHKLGVRYVWFNKRIPNKTEFEMGKVVFSNNHVAILRI